MSLHYSTNQNRVLIGSKSEANTRTSVALTNAYDNAATTKIFEAGGYSKLNLDILYTMGSGEAGNSIEVRVDQSPDRTNFYRIPNESVSSGTSTLTAREFTFVGSDAAAATISIGLDIFYENIRISVKETGVATNAGTIYVEGTIWGK